MIVDQSTSHLQFINRSGNLTCEVLQKECDIDFLQFEAAEAVIGPFKRFRSGHTCFATARPSRSAWSDAWLLPGGLENSISSACLDAAS